MSRSLISAQIKVIMAGVSGIGAIYEYERHSRSLAEFITLMTSSGAVNGWMITRAATSSTRDTYPTIMRNHTFKISGIYALDDENSSETTLQDICDAIYAAFKSNYTINSTALNSDPVSIDAVDVLEIGGKLYHTAELTLLVQERDTYS